MIKLYTYGMRIPLSPNLVRTLEELHFFLLFMTWIRLCWNYEGYNRNKKRHWAQNVIFLFCFLLQILKKKEDVQGFLYISLPNDIYRRTRQHGHKIKCKLCRLFYSVWLSKNPITWTTVISLFFKQAIIHVKPSFVAFRNLLKK